MESFRKRKDFQVLEAVSTGEKEVHPGAGLLKGYVDESILVKRAGDRSGRWTRGRALGAESEGLLSP